MKSYTELLARLLLAHIFILAGLSKIGAYSGTQGYMEAMGVPGMLLPLVIAFEILAGLAIVMGLKTRLVALALAAFSVLTAVIFHSDLGDQTQMILLMKNLAMAGGFLLLVVHGAGRISLDHKFGWQ